MLHNAFYRLAYAVVRSDLTPAQTCLLRDAKLLSKLVQSLKRYSGPHKASSAQAFGLRLLNVVRLEVASRPRGHWLRQYCDSHDGWKAVQERLVELTVHQRTPHTKSGASTGKGMQQYLAEMAEAHEVGLGWVQHAAPAPCRAADADPRALHSSAFAKSIGFEGVKPAVEAAATSDSDAASDAAGGGGGGKRKRKKHKKKKKEVE